MRWACLAGARGQGIYWSDILFGYTPRQFVSLRQHPSAVCGAGHSPPCSETPALYDRSSQYPHLLDQSLKKNLPDAPTSTSDYDVG